MKNVTRALLLLTLVFVVINYLNIPVYANDFPKYNLASAHYEGISVDDEGNIYLGNISRSIIEIYTPLGDQKNAIGFEADGGGFSFEISNHQLIVAVTRTQKIYTYDLNGNLMETSSDTNGSTYDSLMGKNQNTFTDSRGNTYQIKGSLLGEPYIDKISKASSQRVKILAVSKNAAHISLLDKILMGIFFVIVITVSYFLFEEKVKKRKEYKK